MRIKNSVLVRHGISLCKNPCGSSGILCIQRNTDANPMFKVHGEFLCKWSKSGRCAGGNDEKIIFHMDVRTGNILEIEKDNEDKIYYLKSTLYAWYDDFKERLLEDYHNGRYTMLLEW